MHLSGAEIAQILAAFFTGIAAIIAAFRANTAAKGSKESNVKLDEAKEKLEAVHETTNGNLTKRDEKIADLEQGNKYLRKMIVELLPGVSIREFEEIREKVGKEAELPKSLADSATFNFRSAKMELDSEPKE